MQSLYDIETKAVTRQATSRPPWQHSWLRLARWYLRQRLAPQPTITIHNGRKYVA